MPTGSTGWTYQKLVTIKVTVTVMVRGAELGLGLKVRVRVRVRVGLEVGLAGCVGYPACAGLCHPSSPEVRNHQGQDATLDHSG